MNHTINGARGAPQRLIKVKLRAGLLHLTRAKRLNRDDQLLVKAAIVILFAYPRRALPAAEPEQRFAPVANS
jgi:hypothetical protein